MSEIGAVTRFCRSADLFLNVSGSCWLRDEYRGARRTAYLDSDPGYTQAKLLAYDRGVVLSDVTPDGPGEAAGLRAGDVVLALDGKAMENARQFDVNLYRRKPGETVRLALHRGTGPLEVDVGVVARDEDDDRFLALVTPERNLIPRLGVLALELDEKLRGAVGQLRGREGVLVAARAASGDDGNELRTGDVIYAVNGVSVLGLAELRAAVERPEAGQPLVLHVEREGRLLYVVVELE